MGVDGGGQTSVVSPKDQLTRGPTWRSRTSPTPIVVSTEDDFHADWLIIE